MSMVVTEYEVPTGFMFQLELPCGSVLLKLTVLKVVDDETGTVKEQPVMYFLSDDQEDTLTEVRKFALYTPGTPIGELELYVGTFMFNRGQHSFHLFEQYNLGEEEK